MIEIPNSKGRNFEKPFPGCLGRMVNLLDLSTGMAGNRLLTEKPHCDGDQLGSALSRSRSDVARMSRSIGDTDDDKMILSELRPSSNKNLYGTPIKMLIAEEMSKDLKSKHNPPGVVAKLMGLDALPQWQSDTVSRRSHSRSYSTSILPHAGRPVDFWQQENYFLEKRMKCEVNQCSEQTECKDVYEILQHSQRSNSVLDKSLQKGWNRKDIYENKMALVRQKFVEAKSLATDEKLRQSKEFQDALEVLSSNRDLFIKFLQEPNALFSKHLYDLDYISPSTESKRITILRPSMTVNNDKAFTSAKKKENKTRKPSQMGKANDLHQNSDMPSQPTRIVVLKPSPGDTHDYKSVVSPISSSARTVHGEIFCEEPEDDGAQESREVAKEITRQVRENISGDHSDETVLSSVCSNGYVGDESSFHKSETEYAIEGLSDSEVTTPTSRHSWDYINRFRTPFSPSSFTRASCSPESSVCREAKKRLSERWALLALNRDSQEQMNVRKSSSTLGEMLALSETPKSVNREDEVGTNEKESGGPLSCSTSNLNKEDIEDDSCRNLSRSKSVPVSLIEHSMSLNGELVATPDLRELTKAKSMKTSFKGKVSSLFFSRNKKSAKNKSQLIDASQATTSESPVTLQHNIMYGDDVSQCVNESSLERGLSHCLHTSARDSVNTGSTQGNLIEKATSENFCENQDQPSPISILELPFEEDDTSPVSSGRKDSINPIKSNMIGKSPPIGSIARTLSWQEDSNTVTSPPKPEQEQDWRLLIQSLLALAGIDGNSNSKSFISEWHSSESALHPYLREKFVNLDDKKFIQGAKRRQLRSSRKLVYDSVNAALLDITNYDASSLMLVDKVWSWMKPSLYDELRCNLSDDGDENDLIVEMVVRKEVVGKMWTDRVALERANVEREIENKLIEELVEEAVVEFTAIVL